MSWEVRTMGSGTSSFKFHGWFNPTLFKKNLTRFWPIWAVYTAVLAFLLPVELLLTLTSRSNLLVNVGNLEDVRNIVRVATAAMPTVGFLFGAMAAIALFSYLMNARSVQMLHALPIRREGLFLTNWLSGFAFFLAPNLALLLISALIEAGMGVLDPRGLVLWLVTATVCPMFFFCFTVCIAMFTGHVLALPVFYGILNVLVIGVCALMDFAGGLMLYNYNGNHLMDSDLARWCTPVYQLYHLLVSGRYDITAQAVTAVAGYCVVLGAAFTLIAVLVYQRRQLERAGDVITVGWVRPVFQYGLGVCVGLLFGLVLYTNFFYSFGCGAYIFLTALCAVIGAFAGRMLLKKTLRVFADGWKGCFALGVVMALALFGVRADFLGFQRWTPDPAQVVSVQIHGPHTLPDDDGKYLDQTFTDAADIRRIVALHKALNADMQTLRDLKEHSGDYERWDEEGEYQIMGTQYLRLSYTMADGSVVNRWYDPIPVYQETLEDPDTYAGMLNALLNDPRVMGQTYWRYLGEIDGSDVKPTGGWIFRAAPAEKYEEDVELGGSPAGATYTQSDDLTLTDQAARMLWQAFWEDLSAGRVHRYLLDDKARQENCYVSDINISLSWTVVDGSGERSTRSQDFTFTPEKSATSVMAALEELGLKDRLTQRGARAGR